METDLLDAINDLHKQATHERSHFYVASVLERCDAEIRMLREAIKHCPVGPCPVLAALALKELV